MGSKSTIRHTMIAALLVLATVAIELQPLVFGSGSGCNCGVVSTLDAVALKRLAPGLQQQPAASVTAHSETSCCSSIAQQQEQTSCCTSQPATAKSCGCNPDATTCDCGSRCQCSVGDDSNSPPLAIPTRETTDVVTPTLICAAPFVGYPGDRQSRRTDYLRTAAAHAARSSLQTCVLLSRFTC